MTKVLPKPPKRTHLRLIREYAFFSCPKCGSTADKKYWFWGPMKCIHPECDYNENINNSSNR